MSLSIVLEYLIAYRYFLIVPLGIFEGPIITVLCGFLWKLGYFNVIPLYIILVLGNTISDTFWYGIGYFWGHGFIRRFGKYFSITEAKILQVEEMIRNNHRKILFISKITMGFGLPIVTLMAAGMAKIKFRQYFTFNALGQFVWTAGLMLIGYLFGNFYLTIDKGFRWMTVTALCLILVALIFGLERYVRAKKKLSEVLPPPLS